MLRRSIATLGLLLAASACRDEAPPPPRAQPASAGEIASALHVDAQALEKSLEAPSDPPPPSGDLAAEIAQFTTVDACVKARSGLDPLLGDALGAIGYDTFVVDACRILEAVKAKSVKKCAPIDASMLRGRCERLAAIAAGDADACPFAMSSKAALGRDATCVAAALRDARLCAGEQPLERASCTALVGHDDKACASFARDVERERCRRDAHRFAPLLEGGNAAPSDPLPKVAARLTLTPLEGSPDAGAGDTDASEEIARGVVVVDQRDGARFDLGDYREMGLGFLPPPPIARPHLALSIQSSLGGKLTRAERAELGVPGVATLLSPAARVELKVTVEKLERTRGGAVKLVIDGEIGSPGRGYKVRYDVSTFVRDVVAASAIPMLPPPIVPRDGGAKTP